MSATDTIETERRIETGLASAISELARSELAVSAASQQRALDYIGTLAKACTALNMKHAETAAEQEDLRRTVIRFTAAVDDAVKLYTALASRAVVQQQLHQIALEAMFATHPNPEALRAAFEPAARSFKADASIVEPDEEDVDAMRVTVDGLLDALRRDAPKAAAQQLAVETEEQLDAEARRIANLA